VNGPNKRAAWGDIPAPFRFLGGSRDGGGCINCCHSCHGLKSPSGIPFVDAVKRSKRGRMMRNAIVACVTSALLLWYGAAASAPYEDTPQTISQIEREINMYWGRTGWPAAKCFDIGVFRGFAYASKAPFAAYERDAAEAFVAAGLLRPTSEPTVLPYGEERGAANWYEVTELGRPYTRPGEHAMCFGNVSGFRVIRLGEPRSTILGIQRDVTYTFTVSNMPEFTQRPPFSDRLRAPENRTYTPTIDLYLYNQEWVVEIPRIEFEAHGAHFR
jgi:hypothetical protein